MNINPSTASRKAQAIVHRLLRENPNATDFEIACAFEEVVNRDESLKGLTCPNANITEDWICVDCVNTAPGLHTRWSRSQVSRRNS